MVSTLDDQEQERVKKAAIELTTAASNIIDQYDLNIKELLRAALLTHTCILESVQEQIEK